MRGNLTLGEYLYKKEVLSMRGCECDGGLCGLGFLSVLQFASKTVCTQPLKYHDGRESWYNSPFCCSMRGVVLRGW